MWDHQTDQKHGWKYSITSNAYIVRITGGSIAILDRQTNAVLRQHKGHHYLYTGDISPDETQCFALENGKHFYVYSLENYELIKRVTLPRGYECIDMYGHYTEDGKYICIPAHKWIGNESIGEGYYEYVMFQYDAQALTLIEKAIIDDPNKHWWKMDDSVPEMDPGEAESFQRIINIVMDNLENKDFVDRMLGIKPEDGDPAVEAIMKLMFGNEEA